MTTLIQREHISYIVGDDLDELISEALKCVTRHRDWYQDQMRKDLSLRGRSTISRFSNCFAGGMVVFYDKFGKVNIDNLKTLQTNEIYSLYPEIDNKKQ